MVDRKSILKPEEDPASEVQDDQGKKERKHKKKVCWGDLEIMEFPNLLGDNPGVSEGAPLTIGWKHESKSIVGVDYYEYLRQSRPRRKRKDLIVPSAARDTFLLGMGYKLDQIVNAAEETKRIRKSRQSNMKGSWDKFRSVFEKSVPAALRRRTSLPNILLAKAG